MTVPSPAPPSMSPRAEVSQVKGSRFMGLVPAMMPVGHCGRGQDALAATSAASWPPASPSRE